MQLSDCITNARTLLKTDVNGLGNADAISLANEAQFAITADLIKRGINAAQLQEAYSPAQVNVGTYSWPQDLWMVKEVMVNNIDQNKANYVECDIVDVGNLPTGTNAQTMRTNQSMTNPVIENRGDWFEFFPTITATNVATAALPTFFWLFYFLVPPLFVSAAGDGTDVQVPYPMSLEPYLLAARMAEIQALRGNEEGALERAKGYAHVYQEKLNTSEKILKQATQKPMVFAPLGLTGREF